MIKIFRVKVYRLGANKLYKPSKGPILYLVRAPSPSAASGRRPSAPCALHISSNAGPLAQAACTHRAPMRADHVSPSARPDAPLSPALAPFAAVQPPQLGRLFPGPLPHARQRSAHEQVSRGDGSATVPARGPVHRHSLASALRGQEPARGSGARWPAACRWLVFYVFPVFMLAVRVLKGIVLFKRGHIADKKVRPPPPPALRLVRSRPPAPGGATATLGRAWRVTLASAVALHARRRTAPPLRWSGSGLRQGAQTGRAFQRTHAHARHLLARVVTAPSGAKLNASTHACRCCRRRSPRRSSTTGWMRSWAPATCPASSSTQRVSERCAQGRHPGAPIPRVTLTIRALQRSLLLLLRRRQSGKV